MRNIFITLKNSFSGHLLPKVFLALLVLVIVPIAVLSVIFLSISREAVKSSVWRDHSEIVKLAAKRINRAIKEPHDALVLTSSIIGVTHPDSWGEETILVELALDMHMYNKIVSVNGNGIETAGSVPGQKGKDWSAVPAFRSAMQDGFYLSEVEISPQEVPFATMSVPVKWRGRITGALIAEVSLRDVWDAVEKIRIGKNGQTFIVSKSGSLIAHTDKKRAVARENLIFEPVVIDVLSGNTGNREYVDAMGSHWMSSYTPVSDAGWGLVIQQEEKDAYAFYHEMQKYTFRILVISGFAILLVSIIIAEVAMRPVEALLKGTDQVAGGDFDYQINLKRRDELGRLSSRFDEMTLRLKKARDAEKLSLIGTMTSSVVHEMRNPLTSIISFVDMIKSDSQSLKTRQYSEIVLNELLRLNDMLEKLLTFSRTRAFQPAPVQIKELLDEVLALMDNNLNRMKVNVQIARVQEPLPPVSADKNQLKQVFINLILNGAQAMPQGGDLTVSASEKNEGVEIDFRDKGVGIPGGDLPGIFEPFRTTKPGGTGLGLFVSKRIIEDHGGTINVDSEPGKGTTFKVFLKKT